MSHTALKISRTLLISIFVFTSPGCYSNKKDVIDDFHGRTRAGRVGDSLLEKQEKYTPKEIQEKYTSKSFEGPPSGQNENGPKNRGSDLDLKLRHYKESIK